MFDVFANAQKLNIIQTADYGYVQQYATVTACMADFGMQAFFAKTYCTKQQQPACIDYKYIIKHPETKKKQYNRYKAQWEIITIPGLDEVKTTPALACQFCFPPEQIRTISAAATIDSIKNNGIKEFPLINGGFDFYRFYQTQSKCTPHFCQFQEKKWPNAFKKTSTVMTSSLDGDTKSREWLELKIDSKWEQWKVEVGSALVTGPYLYECGRCTKGLQYPIHVDTNELDIRQVSCETCLRGKYPMYTWQGGQAYGTWTCQSCKNNNYIKVDDIQATAVCEKCGDGTELYQGADDNYMRKCTTCPVGKKEWKYYEKETGHSKCIYCEDGKFQPLSGQTSCNLCIGFVVNYILCCTEWDMYRKIDQQNCDRMPIAKLVYDSVGLHISNIDQIPNTWVNQIEDNTVSATGLRDIPLGFEFINITMFKTLDVQLCENCPLNYFRDQCGSPGYDLKFYVRYGNESKTVKNWQWQYTQQWQQIVNESNDLDNYLDATQTDDLSLHIKKQTTKPSPVISTMSAIYCQSEFTNDIEQAWTFKNNFMTKSSYASQRNYNTFYNIWKPGLVRNWTVALVLSDERVACVTFDKKPVYEAIMSLPYGNADIIEIWEFTDIDQSLATWGEIVREGTCQLCKSCGNGFMTLNCKSNNAGECQQCRTACAENEYWVHDSRYGCYPQAVNGTRTYMPTRDYECRKCPIYIKTDIGIDGMDSVVALVVGCSGRSKIDRWHIHAEVKFDSTGSPTPSTLTYEVESMTCAYDDSEACYYKGLPFVLSAHKFPYIYPKAEDLSVQQYTRLIPYCPPGWFVDTAKLDTENQKYLPRACIKCSVCDYAKGQKRTSTWKQCNGDGISDTQTCTTDNVCAIGEYFNVTKNQCQACTRCL